MKKYKICAKKLRSKIELHLSNGALKKFCYNNNLNQCNLSIEFRRLTGMTFKSYVNNYRKTIFEKFIADGCNEKGYSIADKLGFKTEHQFYKRVKKIYGKTYNAFKIKC